eukprot:1149456-Pelagomonas_calceolata.AAC.2
MHRLMQWAYGFTVAACLEVKLCIEEQQCCVEERGGGEADFSGDKNRRPVSECCGRGTMPLRSRLESSNGRGQQTRSQDHTRKLPMSIETAFK